MKTKICRDCKIKKMSDEFRKNSKQCRKCEALYKKEYYQKTKEHKKQYSKNYRNTHLDLYQNYRNEHKDEMKIYNQNYYKCNKQKIINLNIEYAKKREKEDLLYKFKKQIRKAIYNSFYRLKYYKIDKTEKIVGINVNNLIEYLLKTYKNNYGYEWDGKEKVHIDHIIPLSIAQTEKEVIKLCHYTNLQLLKEKDNLEKSSKLNWELK